MKITRRQLRQIIRESLEEADEREQKLTIEKVIVMLEKGQSIKGNSAAKKLLQKADINIGKFKHGDLISKNLKELLDNIADQPAPLTTAKFMFAVKKTIDIEDIAAIITPILLASIPGGRLINVIASSLIERGLKKASTAFRQAMMEHAYKKGITMQLAGDPNSGPIPRVGSLAEVLREFKRADFGSADIGGLDISDIGTAPPLEEPQRSGGGGGGKIHQLVRVNFDQGSEFNPTAYTKTPVDMSPGSPFAKMREIYKGFSNQTKNALYQMFPGGIDPESEDSDNVWLLRNEYMNLLNTMDDAVPAGGDYEYFAVFHPEYASGKNKVKLLDLYRRVAGYTPDEALLEEYEIIMHSASAMFG